jgi:phosphomevalonate kinase
MIAGFAKGDIKLIQKQIRVNRLILQKFGQLNHIAVEIPRLHQLIQIAEKHHGAAKTSGAGGGDCGIVIGSAATEVNALKQEWRANGILPLDFQVHPVQQTVVTESEN